MSAHIADAVDDTDVLTADPVLIEKKIQYVVENEAHAGPYL